jgi:transposase InsO family protein
MKGGFDNMLRQREMVHPLTGAYNPQPNGKCERYRRTEEMDRSRAEVAAQLQEYNTAAQFGQTEVRRSRGLGIWYERSGTMVFSEGNGARDLLGQCMEQVANPINTPLIDWFRTGFVRWFDLTSFCRCHADGQKVGVRTRGARNRSVLPLR